MRTLLNRLNFIISTVCLSGMIHAGFGHSSTETFNSSALLHEEGRGSWEDSACAGIMGEKVLTDFIDGGEGFRLNALCSNEAMAELDGIRGKAVSLLRSLLESGGYDRSIPVLISVIRRCSVFSITGMNSAESGLIAYCENLNICDDFCEGVQIMHNGGSPGPRFFITSDFSFVLTPGNACRNASCTAITHNDFSAGIIPVPAKVNRRIFSDLYRQFLYIKNKNGYPPCAGYMAYIFSPGLFHSSIRLFQKYCYNKAQYKNLIYNRCYCLCRILPGYCSAPATPSSYNIRCLPVNAPPVPAAVLPQAEYNHTGGVKT